MSKNRLPKNFHIDPIPHGEEPSDGASELMVGRLVKEDGVFIGFTGDIPTKVSYGIGGPTISFIPLMRDEALWLIEKLQDTLSEKNY